MTSLLLPGGCDSYVDACMWSSQAPEQAEGLLVSEVLGKGGLCHGSSLSSEMMPSCNVPQQSEQNT